MPIFLNQLQIVGGTDKKFKWIGIKVQTSSSFFFLTVFTMWLHSVWRDCPLCKVQYVCDLISACVRHSAIRLPRLALIILHVSSTMTFDTARVCGYVTTCDEQTRANMYNLPLYSEDVYSASDSLQSYQKGASGSHLWSLHYWKQFLWLPSDDGDDVCGEAIYRAPGEQARIYSQWENVHD